MNREDLKPLAVVAGILLVYAIVGGLFTKTSFISMISLSFAILFYFVLPGYMMMLHLNMAPLQRIAFGIALSSAVIPVVLYAFDIVNIPLSRFVIALLIIVVSGAAFYLKK